MEEAVPGGNVLDGVEIGQAAGGDVDAGEGACGEGVDGGCPAGEGGGVEGDAAGGEQVAVARPLQAVAGRDAAGGGEEVPGAAGGVADGQVEQGGGRVGLGGGVDEWVEGTVEEAFGERGGCVVRAGVLAVVAGDAELAERGEQVPVVDGETGEQVGGARLEDASETGKSQGSATVLFPQSLQDQRKSGPAVVVVVAGEAQGVAAQARRRVPVPVAGGGGRVRTQRSTAAKAVIGPYRRVSPTTSRAVTAPGRGRRRSFTRPGWQPRPHRGRHSRRSTRRTRRRRS